MTTQGLIPELDRLGAAAIGRSPHAGLIAASGDERTVGGHLIAATNSANVDVLPPGPRRAVFAKRVIMRISRLFLLRQREYNQAMVDAVADLNQQVAVLRARAVNDTNRAAATVTDLGMSVDNLSEQVESLVGLVQDVEHKASDEAQTVRGDLTAVLDQLEGTVARLRRDHQAFIAAISSPHDGVGPVPGEAPAAAGESGGSSAAIAGSPEREAADVRQRIAAVESDAFYERFEDRMRGSQSEVKARLEPYLADLDSVRPLGGAVVDIGCGRGEWLQVLTEAGYEAIGVDTNAQAIAEARELGLHAELADAIAYLNTVPAQSLMAVSAFHLLEHLPHEVQIAMLRASLRALRPGGLLIVETPNPTNLNVGAASFYSDPTHLRPIVPDYLSFVVTDLGFEDVETRFLRPSPLYQPGSSATVTIEDEVMWALRGPMDFAVLAKAGRPSSDTTSEGLLDEEQPPPGTGE